ncbi:hypothetical protein ACR0WG_000323 [Enterococcus faecium]|jgi:hypothetical protein|nr:hypothetical protein [Enterococcus faecium]AGE29409.1 hypothetical protein M7W_771 [Enterococcus faecium ATCC 8459 = NRRL B-2354]EPI19648.1 hypothetical protein D352_02765 [Enterococcus faecium LA4B-2]MDB7104771.1 hypothetical protein [Enterococcus faecium]MDB7251388.1 hypothetical protein [Enterococcus faecium]MDB7279473.1 hypothetical protein [Enterococcus faecium]
MCNSSDQFSLYLVVQENKYDLSAMGLTKIDTGNIEDKYKK